jgi:hypothetical protein
VNFAAITPYVGSQRVFVVVVYFISDSVRKLLDTASCTRPYFPCLELQKRDE